MQKTYHLNGYLLKVIFEPKVIRIESPNQLAEYLSENIEQKTNLLVKHIKKDYDLQFGIPLKISEESMAVEIWGHVFASYLAKVIKKKFDFKLAHKLSNFIINRSDRIDCGERKIDTNRIFWDGLVPIRKLLLWVMPKKLN